MFLDAKEERTRNGRQNNDEGLVGDSLKQLRLVTGRTKDPVMLSNILLLISLYELFETKKSTG